MRHSITGNFSAGWIKIQSRKTDGDGQKIEAPGVNLTDRDEGRVGLNRRVKEATGREGKTEPSVCVCVFV